LEQKTFSVTRIQQKAEKLKLKLVVKTLLEKWERLIQSRYAEGNSLASGSSPMVELAIAT
jgi:hypothetical protein